MNLSAQKIDQLKKIAGIIRKDLILSIFKAGSGHPGGSLGIVDILTVLYFEVLRQKPEDPGWEDRDRLVLSHGHICPSLYATLAEAGYFPKEKLTTLRKFGSSLQGHPHRESLPGIETTSGPLGSGLSESCGMALAAKIDKKDWRVFCLVSDGEHDEGNLWEGVMLAAKYKLDNLIVLVDRNMIQSDGPTEDIMPLDPLALKYTAFGWNVLQINGHDFNEIIDSLYKAFEVNDKPTVIVAQTILGKGVSFMEGKYEWHSKVLSQVDYERAIKELC